MIYSLICYLAFFGSFTYLMGFTGDLFVPKGVSGESEGSLVSALLINFFLIFLFGAQHSIMARTWFKQWWTRIVPEPIERSTFVLAASLALTVIFYFWQPIGGVVWSVEHSFAVGVIFALFLLGWAIVFASSFMINHFDLFGLRQAWLYFKGVPYTYPKFKEPIFYNYVRHPLYFGVLLAFWAAPTMTFSRLFFAIVFTIYTLKAIQWEENDLIKVFGEKYRSYKERVPMLLPTFRKSGEKGSVYRTLAKKDKVV